MLAIKYIWENYTSVVEALGKRGASADLETLAALDIRRRELIGEIEEIRRRRNAVSAKVAEAKRSGDDFVMPVEEMREAAARMKAGEEELAEVEARIREILVSIPNVPHPTVPEGRSEADNVLIREEGAVPAFDFKPLPHWEIGEALGILDFERAAKIAGARFPLYLGLGARLERALAAFMLDLHTEEHGYREILPPVIVNEKSMTGTGQLPKFAEDLFKLEGRDQYLIPTSEVPLTNIHAGEILDASELPLYYAAHTPCFRSEAGSYGRDTRGLIRQHQFNKVEMVKICAPEDSYDELESLLASAEEVLRRLSLPYRVVNLCAGDLGFSSAKTYDIEVWMPAQNCYREISSCSNFEAFQARRAGLRFRREAGGKTELLHTLNGSGLAVGRTVAALLENCQQADGTVVIPEALRPYMGGLEVIGG